jgi:hypothetical protein
MAHGTGHTIMKDDFAKRLADETPDPIVATISKAASSTATQAATVREATLRERNITNES